MLIDYGSTRSAREGRAKGRMREVAKLIAEHTHGELDVVVLTHRHKDHLFGFADDTGDKTMRALKPKLVLRPWTEDPDLPAKADGPASRVAPPWSERHRQRGSPRSLSEAQEAVEPARRSTGTAPRAQGGRRGAGEERRRDRAPRRAVRARPRPLPVRRRRRRTRPRSAGPGDHCARSPHRRAGSAGREAARRGPASTGCSRCAPRCNEAAADANLGWSRRRADGPVGPGPVRWLDRASRASRRSIRWPGSCASSTTH